MKYYKNTDLAKIYSVSEKSVRNWIQSAQMGKLDLQLMEDNGRTYIANTSKNTTLVQDLVERGKKYKNKRGFRVISPTPKFYETYSNKQIFDIISNLTIHRELPLKYTYVDGGATYWDAYAQRLIEEDTPNLLSCTIKLLQSNLNDLDDLLADHKYVNIVDLGPGNGSPLKDIIEHFQKQGKLKRYIALDVSKDMLDIAGQNVAKWFNNEVTYEGHVRDFNHERFDDLFAQDYIGNDEDIPVNLIMLLGGTLSNFRSPDMALQTINSSMGLNDILVYSTKLDTPNSRRYFDFNITAASQELAPRHKLPWDLMGIDPSLYEVEQVFDQDKQARSISIRPKIALSIEVKLEKGVRHINLNKDEPILLWRYWHQRAMGIISQFDANDFELMHASKTKDQEYLVSISKIKTK